MFQGKGLLFDCIKTFCFIIGYYINIMLTCPCNVHPLTPHFYIVKLGFKGIPYFLIFALKHRLWVLVRTLNRLPTIYVLSKNMKIVKKKSIKNCHFYSREKSLYVAWACFRIKMYVTYLP